MHELDPMLLFAQGLHSRQQHADWVPPTDRVVRPGQVLGKTAVAPLLDPSHALVVQLADRLKDLLVPSHDGRGRGRGVRMALTLRVQALGHVAVLVRVVGVVESSSPETPGPRKLN